MKNPSITNDISGLNLVSNANQIGLCLINQRNYPFKLKISSENHHSVTAVVLIEVSHFFFNSLLLIFSLYFVCYISYVSFI